MSETTPEFHPETCLRCDVPLEPGFIADSAHAAILQARWCAGEPRPASFLGMSLGEVSPSHLARALKITAQRCPSCGRLELFAHAAH